jgi:ankyrin repeat protein
MDIATTLLEYGANTNADSKAGFTPLHLSAQEGHTDMSTLLLEHQADPNSQSKNGLTPLHLCAQEDRVNVAAILVKNEAEINNQTKVDTSLIKFIFLLQLINVQYSCFSIYRAVTLHCTWPVTLGR